jgi:capsular polysaccharide biosynthesis protein
MFLDNLKFFKTPRHKQFTYRPRYYDEQKEDLQRRVEAAQQEVRGEKEYTREALRTRIDFRAQSKLASRPDFMTNLRVLFIAGIIVGIIYLLIKYS